MRRFQNILVIPYLVLPLELRPHAPELRLGAGGGDNIIHDVNMNIVQNDNIPVTHSTLHVVHDVAENNPILGGRDLHVRFDVGEIVGCKHNRLEINKFLVINVMSTRKQGLLTNSRNRA